ncbi:hypothetical protein AN958_11245 [Leucoagaricus sp. SymC.cos]|nr:hypothetical protein AN958_11245 [Leucoagaricus sp. SymC.cos]
MASRPVLSLRLSKATKDALYKNGYITLQDLLSSTPASIARDLNISLTEVEDILQQAQNPSTQRPGFPLTQSVATIVNSTRRISTRWAPLDKLLKGGLTQGHILEISGPPGCPKERIAVDIVSSVLDAGEGVIFVGTALMYTILDSKPQVTLLVLNSLSFPFSLLPNLRAKSGILDQVKNILTQISAVRNITVVITSQMATKMVKEDGSRGTFDEGAKGMMVPQLGSSYLPSGRSHRVLLSLDGPVSG